MEKIIVLAYCFPPCNATPSERAYSWAAYLNKGNYYPVFITRNWDFDMSNASSDLFKSSGKEVRIEKFDTYEVHYIPYYASWRDQLFTKTTQTKFYFIYLVFSFIYSLLNPLFIRSSSFKHIYRYADDWLGRHTDIKKMVATASPFEFFGMAYLLSKTHNLKWIADYRDDWSTSEVFKASKIKQFLLTHYFSRFEKKWLSTCSSFSSVSEHLVYKIENLIKKPGTCIYNGFMPENYKEQTPQPVNKKFTLCYVGSIYSTQPIIPFLECVNTFIQSYPKDSLQFEVQFVGIKNEPQLYASMLKTTEEYASYYSFTTRLPKKDAITLQQRAHCLLAISHQGIKGSPGSKLYEYLAIKKPVLVYPEKGDILFETLSKTKQGIFCESNEELINALHALYQNFLEHKNTSHHFDQEEINKYTREAQTDKLITMLNKL